MEKFVIATIGSAVLGWVFLRRSKVLKLQSERQKRAKEAAMAKNLSRHSLKYVCDMDVVPGIKVEEVQMLTVPHLREAFADLDAKVHNIRRTALTESGQEFEYANYITDTDCILSDLVRRVKQRPISKAFLRAGPRKTTFFRPETAVAAIVTCGGLCPGINHVIRNLVLTLWHNYGCRTIYGVRDGFKGFHKDYHSKPYILDPDTVKDIHFFGGSYLGSDRGGHEIDAILQFLREKRVDQLYIIGGDGTHRGALKIAEAAEDANMAVSVVGIPKTIDNDVDLIDRSFGFQTAVAEAQRAIQSAKTEASCAINGVGVVKLFGRDAGFIAAHATLASGDVDLCLLPENPLIMGGPGGWLTHVRRRVKDNGHAVIVVAEGYGEFLRKPGDPIEYDAGGNKRIPDVGKAIIDFIKEDFEDFGMQCNVKYLDPSYTIRSVPANPADSLLCMLLAQNAVHGAMAGYTKMTTGLCNNRVVYLPMTAVVASSPRTMTADGRTWERVLSVTRQPNARLNDDSLDAFSPVDEAGDTTKQGVSDRLV